MSMIPDPSDASTKFVVEGNKDDVVGVIRTYILWEVLFHTNGIDFLHEVSKKMKYLFDKVDKSRVMQIEKELNSLDPHSFEKIEGYLARIKEIH